MPLHTLNEAEIIQRLAAVQEPPPFEDAYPSALLSDAPRPAAVLVPLLQMKTIHGDPSWQILFTRRSSTLAEHSGQVAFPGGRSDPEDCSPEDTALREAQEEIGVNPKDVYILGRLPSLPTITNYLVTPVVGVIPWPYPMRLESREVERVFTIPLEWLADPDHHETRQLSHSNLPFLIHSVIYFSPYDGEILWGISGQITVNLIKTLLISK